MCKLLHAVWQVTIIFTTAITALYCRRRQLVGTTFYKKLPSFDGVIVLKDITKVLKKRLLTSAMTIAHLIHDCKCFTNLGKLLTNETKFY